VLSVLNAKNDRVRAIVVCHNIDAREVGEYLKGINDRRLVLIEHRDNISSPAGPLNAGVRNADSEYVTFLGSDDEFDSGVLDAWAAELFGQQVHIGQIFGDQEGRILAPAPRVGRFANLDPVKDLLNYRTAPVGTLVSRKLLTSQDCPGFTESLRTGEDLALGIFLWNTATSITYSRFAQGYRIRQDSADRASMQAHDLASLVLPVIMLLSQDWVSQLEPRALTAVGTKLIRNHVIEPCRNLARQGLFTDSAKLESTQILNTLQTRFPDSISRLPRRDALLCRLLLTANYAEADRRLRRADKGGIVNRAITGNPFLSLIPEGLIRRAFRILLVPRRLHMVDSSPGEKGSSL
jgi:hypothetical protein